MAHNPPRVWMTNEQLADVARSIRPPRQWYDMGDLADKMLARALRGKNVVLSPGTAEVVARALKDAQNNYD